MKTEILKDDSWLVTGFRMEWGPNPKNPPIKANVYEINRTDVIPLSEFLAGRPVVVGDSRKFDANFGNLFLVALDMQDPEALKDDAFFEHFRK